MLIEHMEAAKGGRAKQSKQSSGEAAGSAEVACSGKGESMRQRLKKYALGCCLFMFLFVLIGGGFHLTSGATLLGAMSGTPLVIYGFNRCCDAHRGDEARREAPASEIFSLRE